MNTAMQPFSSMELQVLDSFPFRSTLSLARLFEFWHAVGEENSSPRATVARQIKKRLDEIPALAEPITDPSLLEAHRDLLDLIMVAIFPPALWEETIMAVTAPFHMQPFYSTPTFDRLQIFDKGCPDYLKRGDYTEETFAQMRALYAGYWILEELYQVEMPAKHPMIFVLPDAESGLDKYFKFDFNTHFATIKTKDTIPELSDARIKQLLAEPQNLHLWMEALPPDHFEFQGFIVLSATEVTDQEVLSKLKDDLLQKNALATSEKVQHLQRRLR
ncbi:MAG: hypothetical protein ACE5G0_12145, partial [Rhodothermales bacterium]